MSLIQQLQRRNVVRVVAAYLVTAWLIVQVVETVFPAFGFGDAAVRAIVIVLGIGLVPVAICSWVFELTPEGLKRDRHAGTPTPFTRRMRRRLDGIIMVVLACALTYFAFDKFVLSPPREARIAEAARDAGRSEVLAGTFDSSIVVLPFTNLSADPAQQYLSDGLAAELLALMTDIPRLRVISRASAWAARDRNLGVAELAQELDVDYVLDGSVRKAGDRVRVTAELIEARSDSQVWSMTYDQTIADLLDIQDAIASAVVPSLAAHLELPQDMIRPPQTTAEAFNLYLQGLHYYSQRTVDGYALAVEHLEQVLEADRDYAPAWNLLGSTYINQAYSGSRPYHEAFDEAGKFVDRALELNPDYSFAHSSKAWIAMSYARDYAEAVRYFRSGLALSPNNAVIVGNAAVLARRLGRLEKALELTRRSIELNPVSSVSYGSLADTLMRLGKFDEAEQAARTSMRLAPGSNYGAVLLAAIQVLKGEPLAALETLELVAAGRGYRLVQGLAYDSAGLRDESDEALAQLEGYHAEDSAYNVACIHAWRGDADTAYRWIDRAIDEQQSVYGIKTDPFLERIRDDPRWEPTLARLGLAERQIVDLRL